MARRAEATRTALVSAAEKLFATQGIDQVSLREISRMSGARNAVALQYHFEDRRGIVRAIIEKHYPEVDADRHRLLDAYESAGRVDLRRLGEALVVPSAAKLSDPDGGREYLQISAELLNRPGAVSAPAEDGSGSDNESSDAINRWRRLVEPFLADDAARLHFRFTAIRFSAIELGRRAASGPHRDDRLFVSQLVDLVVALLQAPVSGATRDLAADRDRRRRPVVTAGRRRAG